MQAFGPQALLQEGMDDGDIAVACDPFGMFEKVAEPEPVDYADAAVASTHAQNGADAGIVEHFLEVRSALVIGAGKGIAPFEQVPAEYRMQAPGTEDCDGRLDFLFGKTAGRCRNPNGITGAEAGRRDHDDVISLK